VYKRQDFPEPLRLGDGVQLVYLGESTSVNFTNEYDGQVFVVGLVPNDGNLENGTLLGPVSTVDLTQESDFDRYLEDNPFVEGLLGDEIVSFAEIDGFIALEYFSLWPLMLLIYIAIKTGTTISKHVDDQSMDILLATGYSRTRFMTEKLLVVVVNLVLVVVSAWLGVILGVVMIGEPIPVSGLTLAFIGSVPMAIGIIGLSLVLSVVIDEQSKTTGAIMGLTIFMFMIQIVSNVASWQDSLGYLSLFRYFNVNELMLDLFVDPVNVVVPIVIGILSVVASYVLFNRKDIHA
jgi:ABC-2 type transport system permease protein